MSRLKLGMVGAGRIARAYAEVIGGCDTIEIVGVADIDGRAAGTVADGLGCASFSSHTEMADKGQPSAVVVCTPPNTHTAIVLDFLSRGVHVMCEKPLATTVPDALKMLSAADDNGAILTMASKFRYVVDVLRAQSILASGVLGDVILLENTFASRVPMHDRWNSDAEIGGGGVLIDNGTHSVDIVRFFLGPVAEVMAVEGIKAQDIDVEDTAQVFLRGVNGARATVDLSWSIDKARDWYLEIYGSEGTIQVGWKSSRSRRRSDSDWSVFGSGYSRNQAIRDQLRNFAGAILGTESLRIDAADALASVEVIEAAYRSLTQDDWIRVESNGHTPHL